MALTTKVTVPGPRKKVWACCRRIEAVLSAFPADGRLAECDVTFVFRNAGTPDKLLAVSYDRDKKGWSAFVSVTNEDVTDGRGNASGGGRSAARARDDLLFNFAADIDADIPFESFDAVDIEINGSIGASIMHALQGAFIAK
jgi:hypothetical protein